MEVKEGKVWLQTVPVNVKNQVVERVFSLNYVSDGKEIYTDVMGYRPNPELIMKKNTVYNAVLTFDIENDNNLKIIKVLRKISIPNKETITYVR